jgi:hypothetical protein
VTGSGRHRRALTALKTMVLMAIPRANVAVTVRVNAGARRSARIASRVVLAEGGVRVSPFADYFTQQSTTAQEQQ